ncbi:MAG TPA: M23 family metallopeptidase [Trueperaceae bacterium]|nr:M23 family metallopeptidase [Trueperaceae bacterium]
MTNLIKKILASSFLALSLIVLADNPIGCPGVEYPKWENSEYVLPFAVGKTVKVQLGNCSSSYHSEQYPDKFAYDFVMDIGTEILASRAGKVIYVEESGRDYRHPNNLVVVDHGDNTFAEYMHLTHNGAAVEVGDEVKAGDLIGLSGATGLAGYPHLHFIVVKNDPSWPYEAIPITFRNTEANPRGLKSYTHYTALPFE